MHFPLSIPRSVFSFPSFPVLGINVSEYISTS
uniref:Uncharacterized protein n=1 Tax=Musa acuminata subsp. malaccensis TaxID=214687 RepID=A0A804J3G6_MUSAM